MSNDIHFWMNEANDLLTQIALENCHPWVRHLYNLGWVSPAFIEQKSAEHRA